MSLLLIVSSLLIMSLLLILSLLIASLLSIVSLSIVLLSMVSLLLVLSCPGDQRMDRGNADDEGGWPLGAVHPLGWDQISQISQYPATYRGCFFSPSLIEKKRFARFHECLSRVFSTAAVCSRTTGDVILRSIVLVLIVGYDAKAVWRLVVHWLPPPLLLYRTVWYSKLLPVIPVYIWIDVGCLLSCIRAELRSIWPCQQVLLAATVADIYIYFMSILFCFAIKNKVAFCWPESTNTPYRHCRDATTTGW